MVLPDTPAEYINYIRMLKKESNGKATIKSGDRKKGCVSPRLQIPQGQRKSLILVAVGIDKKKYATIS